jgi:hypothetical protein
MMGTSQIKSIGNQKGFFILLQKPLITSKRIMETTPMETTTIASSTTEYGSSHYDILYWKSL